jgi:glutamate racemase
VIACNSASAAAKDLLLETFGQRCPIVDVITPLIEDIAAQNFRKVGVIATKATIRSDIYARELHALQAQIEVVSLATALLAPIIEEGFFNNSISQSVIHKYLSYPDFEDIEALLLACTHYPLIREEIEAYFQGRVQVFDSIAPVIRRIAKHLDQQQLHSDGSVPSTAQFFVSDYTKSFEQTAQIFYQKSISLQIAKWDKNGQLKASSVVL